MALNHEESVIAGTLPGRRLNLLYLLQNITTEHFRQSLYKALYSTLSQYFDLSNGVIPLEVLGDLLERSSVPAATALTYMEAYKQCLALEVSDEEFRYSVYALKDTRAHQLTGEAIATSFEILERGTEIGNETLRGHDDARTFLTAKNSEIEKMEAAQETPEGDMRHEIKDVVQEYVDAQKGLGKGVLSGIDSFDKASGGFHKGELALIAAFTNAGKSNLCAQIAWHASVMQGKNVFFATSETVRSVVRRRIIARHSALPKFGLNRPLNSADIRDGTLSKDELLAFKAVLMDFDTNADYGRCYIAQVPRGATLSYFEARMQAAQHEWYVDLSILDSINLLRSERKRDSSREELNDLLKDSKTFCTSFNNGIGVPLVSPWQIKREAFNEALRTGHYLLDSLSDTSEAEKSPDAILALLRTPEMKNEVGLQILKMRDNEVPDPVTLEIDLRAAVFRDKKSGYSGGTGFGNSLLT